jgi:hypothetical protein
MSQYNDSARRIGKDMEGGGQVITSYFSGVNEKPFVRVFDLRTQESKTRRSESDKTDVSIRPLFLVMLSESAFHLTDSVILHIYTPGYPPTRWSASRANLAHTSASWACGGVQNWTKVTRPLTDCSYSTCTLTVLEQVAWDKRQTYSLTERLEDRSPNWPTDWIILYNLWI